MEFIMYPTTVKMLAAEIITVCDAYISRKVSTDDLKKLIFHYASTYSDMLFNVQELNPTVLNRIGKKRATLINKMLEGYQYKRKISYNEKSIQSARRRNAPENIIFTSKT